jgi:hypothetical protein
MKMFINAPLLRVNMPDDQLIIAKAFSAANSPACRIMEERVVINIKKVAQETGQLLMSMPTALKSLKRTW